MFINSGALCLTLPHLAAKYQTLGKGAGAAVAGAVATVAASQGREKRSQAASVALYNDLMQRDDPGSISTEEVKAIGSRYGVDFSQTQVGDLQQIYSEFLAALIPTDETPLTYVPNCPCLPCAVGTCDWHIQVAVVSYGGVNKACLAACIHCAACAYQQDVCMRHMLTQS